MERVAVSEREIMPKDLLEFYGRARKNTYAGSVKPETGITIPNSKGYRYSEEGSPYYYQDEYFDTSDRPGNFGGLELIRKESFEGQEVSLYSYAGGLTERGLELGEGAVYTILQQFLSDKASQARFGNTLNTELENESGTWAYQGDGEVTPWGWIDSEKILLNGELVYELRGTGICFIPGY